MPFSPLPATIRADLQHAEVRSVLELGSGDGGFTALLRKLGVVPVTLDRRSRQCGARAAIRGDALQPPLRRPFDLVVAANLLRHLWAAVDRRGPVAWRDLVDRRGRLWILEDEPCDHPPQARNYRDLQDLLARLLPAGRSCLLPLEVFRRHRATWAWPGRWQDGLLENRWQLDVGAILDLLEEGRPRPGGEVASLAERIRSQGISCGRCWWARWQPEDAS